MAPAMVDHILHGSRPLRRDIEHNIIQRSRAAATQRAVVQVSRHQHQPALHEVEVPIEGLAERPIAMALDDEGRKRAAIADPDASTALVPMNVTAAAPVSPDEARENRRVRLNKLNAKLPNRLAHARSVREAKKLTKSDVEFSKHRVIYRSPDE
jgi:hypothetical protein